MERGAKIEEKARLELELAQEQFYCEKLPQKRQLAVIGIVENVVVIVVLFVFMIGIFKGTFGIVVGPLVLIIWVVWIVVSGREWTKDLKYLSQEKFDMELSQSLAKQGRLKDQIEQLENEIASIPVTKWQS
jgi:hypothetical protein